MSSLILKWSSESQGLNPRDDFEDVVDMQPANVQQLSDAIKDQVIL